MPIIFLINNRDAGMSKNQSCRLLEKPFWDAGHFQLFQSFKRSSSRMLWWRGCPTDGIHSPRERALAKAYPPANIGSLLRARCERPCYCRAAQQRQELATLQLNELHPLPPTIERQDSGLASIKSGLLRCGILTRLLTG
jgi:hypothetical protein